MSFILFSLSTPSLILLSSLLINHGEIKKMKLTNDTWYYPILKPIYKFVRFNPIFSWILQVYMAQ